MIHLPDSRRRSAMSSSQGVVRLQASCGYVVRHGDAGPPEELSLSEIGEHLTKNLIEIERYGNIINKTYSGVLGACHKSTRGPCRTDCFH